MVIRLERKKTAWIDRDKCVGCGACITECPQHAIKMQPGWFSKVDPDKLYFNPWCAITVAKPYMPDIVYAFLKSGIKFFYIFDF